MIILVSKLLLKVAQLILEVVAWSLTVQSDG